MRVSPIQLELFLITKDSQNARVSSQIDTKNGEPVLLRLSWLRGRRLSKLAASQSFALQITP